jgi:hypothetical protein
MRLTILRLCDEDAQPHFNHNPKFSVHNEDDEIKGDEMDKICSTHRREMKNEYSILVGKPERERPSRRPKRRWEDNIRTDLREIGWEGVDWMHVAQYRDQ